jgi:uncharacterized protein (TIGR03382 family)
MRPKLSVLLFVFILTMAITEKVLAAGGTILSLTASGGDTANSTITVQSTVQAVNKLIDSNLYYTITGPGSDPTIRASQRTNLGHLDRNETFSDSWTTNNNGWPAGNYTLTLCWSTGKKTICDIASATTTFYSVPTLGVTLSFVALVLLLGWLWHRRKDFEPILERVKA